MNPKTAYEQAGRPAFSQPPGVITYVRGTVYQLSGARKGKSCIFKTCASPCA